MLRTKDIARLSGVSRTTVSAIINGKPGVRESTRQKVLDIIRDHNGMTGLFRKSLISEVSRMIGVITGSINNPFFTEVVSGIVSVLRPNGFHHMLLHATEDLPTEELAFDISALMGYNPPGYIVVGGLAKDDEDAIRKVIAAKIPLVAISPVAGIESHTVDIANRIASKEATTYLLNRGHRRLTCLTGPPYRAVAQERMLGFVEALVAQEIEYSSTSIVRAGETLDEGYAAAMIALSNTKMRPTGLVCFNDRVAGGVYRAARELNLRIPEDISVVGFDGTEMGELMGPPLTTLSVFPKELGRTAAEMLLQVINGNSGRRFLNLTSPHKLIERGSVCDVPVLDVSCTHETGVQKEAAIG